MSVTRRPAMALNAMMPTADAAKFPTFDPVGVMAQP